MIKTHLVKTDREGDLRKHNFVCHLIAFPAITGILVILLTLLAPYSFPYYSHSDTAQASSNEISDSHHERQSQDIILEANTFSVQGDAAGNPTEDTEDIELSKNFDDQQRVGVFVLALVFGVFALTALLTKLCVDIFCQFALRIQLVDKPDINRKLHGTPIPVGGGVVIFGVTFLAILGMALIRGHFIPSPVFAVHMLIPLFIAASILVGVGMIDDKWGMSGKKKLLFQILASSIVIFYAEAYSEVAAFGMTFHLEHLFYPLGILWLVGMINSINLLDGADGVAATTGFLMSVTAGIIAWMSGYTVLFFVATIFSGSLLGFFLCNRPPAKVYLGDTGSMLIGLFAAVLLMRTCTTRDFTINVVPPLAIALIPVLDSIFAVIRRINSGRSIFTPDRGHVHHRLQEKFGKGYRVLGILSLLILPGCVAAIVGIISSNDWIPLSVALGLLGIAAATGIFGREELKLLVLRVVNRFKKHFRTKSYDSSGEVFHFQGNGPWQALWEDFIPSLKGLGCIQAHLDINMPFLHEDFSSEWKNLDLRGQTVIPLQCSLPLICDERQIGKLSITFDNSTGTTIHLLHQAYELSDICTKYIGDYININSAIPAKPQPTAAPSHRVHEKKPVSVLNQN
jgi:UDP-GlcNAc:undecaprenyl-phosphate GlcNAc-1-phosphate transferase